MNTFSAQARAAEWISCNNLEINDASAGNFSRMGRGESCTNESTSSMRRLDVQTAVRGLDSTSVVGFAEVWIEDWDETKICAQRARAKQSIKPS